jgi:hypothetical protein
VNLTTHVQDVVNTILFEDLENLVLVGASYSGIVVAGAADVVFDRIRHLVFLDAVLPLDGQSVLDCGFRLPHVSEDGWRLLPAPTSPNASGDEAEQRSKFVAHPIGTYQQKLSLTVPLEERGFGRTFVRATGWAPPPLVRTGERLREDSRWQYLELPCGHDIHRLMPDQLERILLDLA